jgi:pimeloyl-ACP methyl ester carboxylesterase
MYRRRGAPFDEKMFQARHHLLATANTHRAMIRSIRRWSANRISRDAHLIRQPTMLVWGELDDHTPLSEGLRLRDALPTARLIVFRNCGHLPQAEYPQEFVQVVAEFCKAGETAVDKARTIEFPPRKARKRES